MKKAKFLVSSLVFASLTIGLVGCGAKLPTTSYEKVKFAFNGVEKSFKNPKAAKKSLSLNKKERLGGSNPESALSTIFNMYNQEDVRDDFLDDVEYNQPPMVQFQYLKKVLEKVGSGYEFGTKYYETMEGEVYLDIETGLESDKESDKFNYTFLLGMDINIDDSDLITADVSFDIKIARGAEQYGSKWYVAIELDYDMLNNSPNYTMTMVTENDERDLPYYNHYTYEYNYVEVKNNAISEWRKFCMDNNNRLIKDAAHPNFDAYTGEDAVYKVDACSWFKDGVYYKKKNVKESNSDAAKVVGQALFGDLGLNATEINADAFFNKSGTQNSVLKTCYDEFGKIAKKDIIYDLLTKEEQGGSRQQVKTAIRAMNGDLNGGAENYHISKDTSVGRIFNGFFDAYGEKSVIVLCYIDQDGGLMEEVRDLGSLSFFFGLKGLSATVQFESLDETLESAYNRLLETGEIGPDDIDRECAIFFIDNEDMQIYGVMTFFYEGDLPNTYEKPAWPEALKNYGVPEYDGTNLEYVYSEDPYLQGNNKYLEIKGSTYEEGEAYCTKLIKNGFEQSFDYSTNSDELLFKKALSEQYNLYVKFRHDKNNSPFLLTIWREEIHQDPPQPEQPFHVYTIGDFNNWGKNDPIEFAASYNDGRWSFTLENFHVSAGEVFAFVADPKDPNALAFGYDQLMATGTDTIGLLEVAWDKGPFALKALTEFTATYTVTDDQLLYMEVGTNETEINYLTIVGSFNNWSETEGVIEMEKQSDGSFKKLFTLDAGVEFKIMQNHSWKVNYGYNEIKAFQSADMRHRFTVGDQGNVVTLIPMMIVLTAVCSNGEAKFSVSITNL